METERLALIIALIAVFFGPLVTLYLGRKRVKADVLSRNRQEWINALREEICGVVTRIQYLSVADKTLGVDRWTKEASEIMLHENKIRLLVNPSEKNHQRLCELIEEAIKYLLTQQGRALREIREDIIRLSQTILKKEWERVKRVK